MIVIDKSLGLEMGLLGWLCSTPALVITLPEDIEDIDFCKCLFVCDYIEDAFILSSDETNAYKNDYRSIMVNLRDATSSYEFVLIDSSGVETILIDNTYGELFDTGFNTVQPLLAGYRIEWFKVWENLGYGQYTIKVSQTDFGNTVSKESHVFRLTEFSELASENSVKIETAQTGMILNGQDFGGIAGGWRDMLRVNGTFGSPKPQYEISRLSDSSRIRVGVQTETFNKYTFTAEMLPSQIGNKLMQQDLLTDKIFISNYKGLAYDQYRRLPVVFDGDAEAGDDFSMNDKKNFTITYEDDRSLLKREFV